MNVTELGELIRKVKVTGGSSSARSSDGSLCKFHRFDSKAVMDLIYYIEDSIEGVKEISENPTKEELSRLDAAIDYYEKQTVSPYSSPYDHARLSKLIDLRDKYRVTE